MTAGPRVRFAPAPTGFLHVGGARTALFNWLFARHTGGTFVLRIEDTDAERSREEWVEGIQATLRWLGLDWDEGPYRQGERLALYATAAERLAGEGRAYWCDCTREQIDARTAKRPTPGYDGFCRDRGLDGPAPDRVLRFRTPDDGETVVHDIVRGEVVFAHATLEDFVFVRSTGAPTFFLANAVDDADMAITHVIRGEDLLPSTPRVLLLREALGTGGDAVPVYAHLPLLVGKDRAKLSKRHGDVALEDYREKGYLPEALRNYLALLGWAPADDREILPIEEIVAEFRLEDVTKSAAFFDHQKLDHVNGEYLRAMPVERFMEVAAPWVEDPARAPWPADRFDADAWARLAPLVQERVRTLAEVPHMVDFVFLDEPVVDEASWEKVMVRGADAAAMLDGAIDAYSSPSCEWRAEVLHEVTQAVGEKLGLKLGKAQAPVRVAVTGRTVGPPLFESLEVLGRDRVLTRLRAARARL